MAPFIDDRDRTDDSDAEDIIDDFDDDSGSRGPTSDRVVTEVYHPTLDSIIQNSQDCRSLKIIPKQIPCPALAVEAVQMNASASPTALAARQIVNARIARMYSMDIKSSSAPAMQGLIHASKNRQEKKVKEHKKFLLISGKS